MSLVYAKKSDEIRVCFACVSHVSVCDRSVWYRDLLPGDIKNFYLTAPLDRYEYMKMPLSLFPSWTTEQYNLDKLAKNGFVYLEM